MTDNDDELEAMLRGLPLRRPTAALDARVASAVRGRRWHPVRWAAVLLATVGASWYLVRPRTPAPVAPAVASAVTIERVTSRTVADDTVVSVTDHGPVRQVRRQTVREIWWADPATGARLWAQVPTEQVTVEPAETF